MRPELERSYAWCTRVARQAASSFYFCFFLLPRDRRLAMCALYAFLRKTDDLGDSFDPVADRRAAVRQWRRQLEAALHGVADDPILPALVDTIHRFQIPNEYLTDVIDGVERDLAPQQFETFDDLQDYCHLVASAVGLACIHIWGFEDERAFAPALQCGVAFQLTNILRDLKEDGARGRVYLPAEDLRRFGYSAEELLQGVLDDRLRQLVQFEVDRAERLYREADDLFAYLTPCGRRVFGAMLATYHHLLEEIGHRGSKVLCGRVTVSSWRKLAIVAGWASPVPRHRSAPSGARLTWSCSASADLSPSGENGR